MLYRANFEQRVADLQATIHAQVSLIDAVARFDREHSGSKVSGGSLAATKGQVIDGFSRLGGFGECPRRRFRLPETGRDRAV